MAVAREVYLWNYRDAPELRVGDYVLHLLLGVVSAVAFVPPAVLAGNLAAFASEAAFMRELRMRFYLYTPALVVGHVQVESVDVVHAHKVNLPLELIRIDKCANHIDHHSPVRGLWRGAVKSALEDGRGLKSFSGIDGRRKEAQQVLDAVENSGAIVSCDADTAAVHMKIKALCTIVCSRIDGEDYTTGRAVAPAGGRGWS